MLSEQQISIISSCRLSHLLCKKREFISRRKEQKIVEKLLSEIECIGNNISTINRSKVILVSKLIDDYPDLLHPVSSLLKSFIDNFRYDTSWCDNAESEFCKIVIIQWIKCCSRSNDSGQASEWLMKQLVTICAINTKIDLVAYASLITTFFDVILATSSFIDWRDYAYDIFKCGNAVSRYAFFTATSNIQGIIPNPIFLFFIFVLPLDNFNIRAIAPFSTLERCQLVAAILGTCSSLLQLDDVLACEYKTSSHISVVVDLASFILSSTTYEHSKSKKNALLALMCCCHYDNSHLDLAVKVKLLLFVYLLFICFLALNMFFFNYKKSFSVSAPFAI